MRLCEIPGCGKKHRAGGMCIGCYQKAWVQAKKAIYFDDKSCVVCGSKEHLELDHIDPKTKTLKRIGNGIWHWSETRRLLELAKCQVLCGPCHDKKSTEQRDGVKARGSSKFLGVSWDSRAGMWRVRLQADGKQRHVGYFNDEVEAAGAYDSAMRSIYGEGCFQNLP